MLLMPPRAAGPPEPIIPILLVPKTPPPAAGQQARPQPIRLHRRPQPFLPPDVTPAPIAPPTPPPRRRPGRAQGPVALHPAPQPEGPKGDVRTALRQSPVGCANRLAVGLNRAERDLCDEKLGKGAKNAPFTGLGLRPPTSSALLDAAGARKEADYRYSRPRVRSRRLNRAAAPRTAEADPRQEARQRQAEYTLPIPK